MKEAIRDDWKQRQDEMSEPRAILNQKLKKLEGPEGDAFVGMLDSVIDEDTSKNGPEFDGNEFETASTPLFFNVLEPEIVSFGVPDGI